MPKQKTVGLCLSYNGVCMQDCTIEDWQHRIEYDEHHVQKWDVIQLTVSSLIVSNASSVTSNTRPVGGNDPSRLHASQAFFGSADGGTPAQDGFLATDNWLWVEAALKVPKCDFVLWINDASSDTETFSDEFFPPQESSKRQSPRRILLAACGYAGQQDYSSAATTHNEFVDIIDPSQDTQHPKATTILRRDVLDCQNGPRPLIVSPAPLAGGQSMKVTFTIEICLPIPAIFGLKQGRSITDLENNLIRRAESDNRSRMDPVIYNRWSVVDSMDDAGRVTHTIQGKMIVKDNRYKPHSMRLMAFPLAFPYARLMSRRYAVSEDGKTLSYEFSFTHAGAAPPPGVRNYRATYMERFSPQIKGSMQASMQVQVDGWYHRSDQNPALTISEATQKIVLLRQAHTILWARIRGLRNKLNALPAQQTTNVILLDMQVIEQVGVPSLELRADIAYGGGSPNDIYLRLQNLGKEFFEGVPQQIAAYSPLWWPVDNEWGRLINYDDAHQDYLYTPLGNSSTWKQYDNYFNNSDTAALFAGHYDSKLPTIAGKPKPYKYENSGSATEQKPVDNGDASGSRPTVTGSLQEVTYPDTTNPINQQQAFSAIIAKSLNDSNIPASTPPTPIATTGVWDVNQLQGSYSYITYEAEVLSDAETGKCSLPLSKPRELGGGAFRTAPSAPSIARETSTTIRLFAGSGKRILNVKAERVGNWPSIPNPAETILLSDQTSQGQTVAVDRLVGKKIIHDNPQPLKSGQGLIYTINMRLAYSSSRPWAPDPGQAGYMAADLFPLPVNKMLVHDQATQAATRVAGTNVFVNDAYG